MGSLISQNNFQLLTQKNYAYLSRARKRKRLSVFTVTVITINITLFSYNEKLNEVFQLLLSICSK